MPIYKYSVDVSFFSAVASYFIYILVLLPIRNKKFVFEKFPLSARARWFVALLFILSLFLSYPKVMGVGDLRFGVGGSITLVLLVLVLCSRRPFRQWDPLSGVIFIILVFLVGSGERVDFVLAVIALMAINSRNGQISLGWLMVGCAALFSLGVYAGLARIGIEIQYDKFLDFLFASAFNFGTAIDVVHVYFSGTWYYERFGVSLEPLANVVSSYFPIFPWGGAGHEYNFSWFLRPYIDNVGGGLFYTVGMLALGPLGVLVFGAGYGAITRILFKFSKPYGSIVFVAFFVMQFRLQWYGLTYFGNVLIILLVVYYISALAYKKKGIVERRILMEPRGYK